MARRAASREMPDRARPSQAALPHRRVLGVAGGGELAVAWSHGTPEDPRYRLVLEVPELPELPQKRRHWSHHKHAADHWRVFVRVLVGPQQRPERPLSRARLACTRRSSAEPDYENLAASFKPVVDALCRSTARLRRADVLEDDRPAVVERSYHWERSAALRGSIRVEVVERLA